MKGFSNTYFGARYYSDNIMQWLSVDPKSDKYPSTSPYMYCMGNPVMFVDPDGREPILPFVGSAALFKNLLNNSPRKVGYYKGEQAANYLASLGNTKFNWNQMRLVPTETGYFNKKEGRYIYTEKGGWLDMSHFMFYAGRAYQNKINGNNNPIGDAVQDGYIQERLDRIFAPHSAYSYEDLPSDKYGAEFGAKYFDPNSEKTFGEQLENYLNNVLKATEPTEAPNYHKLSKDYPDKPSVENYTTSPYYINKINNEENN